MKNLLSQQTIKIIVLFFLIPVFGLSTALAAKMQARPYSVVQCPAIQPEYSEAINQLLALKQQFGREAHCIGLAKATDKIYKMAQSKERKTVMDVIRKSKGKILPAKQAQRVQHYATKMTEMGLGLVSMIRGNDRCFKSKRDVQAILGSLSTFVFEASNALSSVAGPYGVPLIVGGGALSGILRGVVNHREKIGGYRFDDPQDSRAYVASLCVYYNYRREAEQMLDPAESLATFKDLGEYLESKIDRYRSECSECSDIISRYEDIHFDVAIEDNSKLLAALRADAKAADSNFESPVVSEALTTAEKFYWVEDEANKYRRLRDGMNSVGMALAQELVIQLDDFMISNQGKKFMEWQLDEGERALKRHAKYTSGWTIPFLHDIKGDGFFIAPIGARYSWKSRYFNSAFEFLGRIKANKSKLTKTKSKATDRYLNSMYKGGLPFLRLAGAYVRSTYEYCGFFSAIGLHGEFYQNCESNRVLDKVKARLIEEFYVDPKNGAVPNYVEIMEQPSVKKLNGNWRESLGNMINYELSLDQDNFKRVY